MATSSAHDRLPYRVPPLCEHCCGVVDVAGLVPRVVVTDWPGTHGVSVYFHPDCHQTALARRRR